MEEHDTVQRERSETAFDTLVGMHSINIKKARFIPIGKPDTIVGDIDLELSIVAYWAQPDDPETGLESMTNSSFGF